MIYIYIYIKFLEKALNRESDHCFIPKLVTVVKIEIMITVPSIDCGAL